MPDLYLYGRKVNSVFQLLGEKENDITYSVAWALTNSKPFLQEFFGLLSVEMPLDDDLSIRLQQFETDAGFTDIEIQSSDLHIIVEAKRGWTLPGTQQLEKYAGRLNASVAPIKMLVVLSECSHEYALAHLEVIKVSEFPVHPVSWKDIFDIAKAAQAHGSHAGKRLIKEFLTYLGGVVTMQVAESNLVYVVSVGSSGFPSNWNISWIDIVEKHRKYFHPMGGRSWPKEPPNYIAFRYRGRLQTIHHIEDYLIFTNPHDHFPEIPETEWPPFFLYTLGPALKPPREVKTGNIFRNGRVWCMLDTLFVCDTVADARDLTKKRMAQV